MSLIQFASPEYRVRLFSVSKNHALAILAHNRVFENRRKIWRNEICIGISAQPIRDAEADPCHYEPAQK